MKRIELYKDSRISWIGEIPKDWKTVSLRRLVLEHRQGFYTSEEYVDQGTKMLRITDINDLAEVSFENCPQVKITEKDFEYFKLSEGDFLFARSGTIGRFGVVQNVSKAIFASYLIKFSFKKNLVEPNFLKNYFFSPLFNSGLLSDLHGGANQNINAENIKNQVLVLPELEEQKKIARHLDNKSQRIIKIIRQKELLLEKLQAKRQAIINEAVTNGLNPNVPMKPSGIEWLGEIPRHWDVKKLKYLATLKSGESITAEQIEYEGMFPVFGGNGIRGYTNSFTHEGNYILIGRQGALCGNINYAENKFWASEHAVVVTPKEKLNLFWLGELLRSMNLNQYSQSAAQPGLAVGNISNLNIPVPRVEEQSEIEIFIKEKDTKIKRLEELLFMQIQKLKSYRQSFISEVVTGKLKVV